MTDSPLADKAATAAGSAADEVTAAASTVTAEVKASTSAAVSEATAVTADVTRSATQAADQAKDAAAKAAADAKAVATKAASDTKAAAAKATRAVDDAATRATNELKPATAKATDGKPAPRRSAAQIESDLDAVRARLAGRIDDLESYVSPKNVAQRGIASVKGVFVDEYGGVKPDRVLIAVGAVVVLLGLRAVGRRRRR